MHGQNPQLAPAVLVEVALDLAAARLEPAQEALQRAAFDALVLQRPRQQLVDRIRGLATQPLQQPPTAALRAERAGEEVERRVGVGVLQPVEQDRAGGGERPLGGALAQSTPQMAGALPGQGEELLFVEPDQRRLQEGREIEVILRQQDEARHRQQVLDRQFLAEIEPVDARDLDALALQRADQRVHELVAPPYQHHEMSGMQRLAVAGAPLLTDQSLGMHRNQAGQPFVRQGMRRACAGAFDVRGVGLVLAGGDQRPQLDAAGFVLAAGQVDHVARTGDAARGLDLTEHPVDRLQNGRRRAERDVEFDRHEDPVGDAAAFAEPLPHLLQLAGVGALEPEDRLLGVADGEDGAAAADRAFAHEELLGEPADHFPLVGIGVLRLVDQHMVDAAVELEEDPGGALGAFQQAARGHDQVVIVEHGATALGARIAVGDVETEPQQRQGAFDQCRAVDAVERLGQPLGFAAQYVFDTRHCLDGGLGRKPRQDFALGREEGLGIGVQHYRPVRGGQPFGDDGAAHLVLLAAPGQCTRRLAKSGRIEGRFLAGRRGQASGRIVDAAAHFLCETRAHALQAGFVANACQQPGPLAQQPGHQLGILGDRDLAGDGREGIGERRRCIAAGQRLHLLVLHAAQDRLGFGLVQNLEARRHAGLEREALQQRLAEGMNGENVDAARRIEHTREQAARHDALGRLRRPVDQSGDAVVEYHLVGQSPAAKLVGEAVAHLGRGRLGEGEAEDALGFHAVQQKPRHAVRQDLRLARAGIGFHPRRMIGRGGAPLRVRREGQGVEHVVHSSPPPAVDHSAIRSRWA